ncbi:phosphatase PAP2 family protein [Candidatus Peregrinibacteria bacterium]|nr:phosphatase PAP2 family protein [Candidatus Peregrinibacteria bacterium]
MPFAFDQSVFDFFLSTRNNQLFSTMLLLTNNLLFVGLAGLLAYLAFHKKRNDLILLVLSVFITIASAYLLKKVFQIPRPSATEDLAKLLFTQVALYSFPSLHAAVCFSVWPLFCKLFKNIWLKIFVFLYIILIIFSRLYLGVHYVSDLVAGAALGYLTGYFFLYLQTKYKAIDWFIHHVKDKLELRRQIAHFVMGITIVLLLKYGILNIPIITAVIVVGGLISIISRFIKVPLVYPILRFFERPKEMKLFPGKGAFFFALGTLVVLHLYEINIAMASIVIMAVGDSITTIIGTYFGRLKNPLNPEKHLEGTVLAIFASTIAAFYIVDFHQAFLASTIGMAFESITSRKIDRIIDDNLLIPLVAGAVMTVLG